MRDLVSWCSYIQFLECASTHVVPPGAFRTVWSLFAIFIFRYVRNTEHLLFQFKAYYIHWGSLALTTSPFPPTIYHPFSIHSHSLKINTTPSYCFSSLFTHLSFLLTSSHTLTTMTPFFPHYSILPCSVSFYPTLARKKSPIPTPFYFFPFARFTHEKYRPLAESFRTHVAKN